MAEYISKQSAVDAGYLSDWYISSVGDEPPVWTDAHIDELLNDFIIIPKDTKATDVQPVDRWISVKDRLPDEGEMVLIYAPRTQNQYYVAMFYTLHDEIKFVMNIYGMSYCWYAEDVTYWQPLSKPLQD